MLSIPSAHETWFVRSVPPLDWSFARSTVTVGLLSLAVLATLLAVVVARLRPNFEIPALARLAPFIPFAIRMHLAVSLVTLLSMGSYMSPAMRLPRSAVGFAFGAVMIIVAIGMATGFRARFAALLLLLAGPIGMVQFGFSPVLQRVDVLGLALFVLIAGPGRWSADHEMGRELLPNSDAIAVAMIALRVCVGAALIIVAFAEKLANPELARRFLSHYPAFNVVRSLELPMSDATFIRCAGAVEVLFGLLLISGSVPQLVAIAVGVPFNITLFVLGAEELAGHLPIYGVMLALLVYGSCARVPYLDAERRRQFLAHPARFARSLETGASGVDRR